MEFIKWPSITNSYNTKFINKFLEEYPELANETYVITEKIHGSSVQIFLQPNTLPQFGKRSSWLKPEEKFYDIWNVLPKYMPLINLLQQYVDNKGFSIRLFAELFGPGVQKEITYASEKLLRVFGMMVNNELSTFENLQKTLDHLSLGPSNGSVPIVGIVESLDRVLDFNIEFPTTFNPIDGNICEGVVIQPYHKVYRNHLGQTFLLKKKNTKFMETQHVKKELKQEPDEVIRLNELFKTYITEARLDTLFSKVGPIEMDSQIGEYIIWYIEDAKKDFIEDHAEEISGLEPKQERKIYNVGSIIANMLKAKL